MHDNGRKCAQGAGEAGVEQAGSLQTHSSESTGLWKLWKVAPEARPPWPAIAHACHDQRGSATPSVRSRTFGRTSSLAIPTAASASAEWAWRKRPAFSEKAGNRLT